MSENPFQAEQLLPTLSNYPVAKGGEGSGRYPKGSFSDPFVEEHKAKAEEQFDKGYELYDFAHTSLDGEDFDKAIEISWQHHEAALAHLGFAELLKQGLNAEITNYADEWGAHLDKLSDKVDQAEKALRQTAVLVRR